MSTPQRTNLGTLLAVGLGSPVRAPQGDHTFTLTVSGSGAVSASVTIMGSNDLLGWVQIASLSAAGTGVGSGSASITSSYAYWRADASALAAGAVASVMAASEEGQGSQSSVSGAGNGARRRYIDFGDSRAAQAYVQIDLPSTPPGTAHRVQGASVWANALAGQRMVWAGNYGVGGNTAAQCVARLSTLDAVQFDWANFHDDLNDIAADRTFADIVADYETIYAYFYNRGAQVIHVGPYAPSVALNSARSQLLLKLRDYILRVPSRLRHVHVVDAFSLFSTASASPPTSPAAYVLDPGTTGYHYNCAGAALIGRAIAAIWTQQVSEAAPLLASAADAYTVDSANNNVNEFGVMLANGGTLGSVVAAPSAWQTGTSYTAGAVRTNAGNVYQAVTSGASGATAPTHGSGTASDGTVSWRFLSATAAWTAVVAPAAFGTSTAYAAGTVITNAGNAYQATNSGTSGATAPTHTGGTASDGAVTWRFLSAVTSTGVANGYTLKRQGTASGIIYVWLAPRADGVGNDQCAVLVDGASGTTIQFNQTADNSSRFNGAVAAGQAAPITEMEVSVANTTGIYSTMARTLIAVDPDGAGGASAVTYQWRSMSPSTELVGNIPYDCTLRLRTPDGVLPASGTVTAFESQFFVSCNAANAAGFFRVGRHSCRL